MEDGKNLNYETSNNDKRSYGQAQYAKAMRFLIHRHDNKADDQDNQSEYHELIVFFAKGKFAHCQYNSSNESLRYFCTERQVLITATKIPIASRLARSIAIRSVFPMS